MLQQRMTNTTCGLFVVGETGGGEGSGNQFAIVHLFAELVHTPSALRCNYIIPPLSPQTFGLWPQQLPLIDLIGGERI